MAWYSQEEDTCVVRLVFWGAPRIRSGFVGAVPEACSLLVKPVKNKKKAQLVSTASNRAKKILQKQYKKTGVAILGCPLECLSVDLKFQGCVEAECIKSGEKLALQSSSAELLVLDTCLVPPQNAMQIYWQSSIS